MDKKCCAPPTPPTPENELGLRSRSLPESFGKPQTIRIPIVLAKTDKAEIGMTTVVTGCPSGSWVSDMESSLVREDAGREARHAGLPLLCWHGNTLRKLSCIAALEAAQERVAVPRRIGPLTPIDRQGL